MEEKDNLVHKNLKSARVLEFLKGPFIPLKIISKLTTTAAVTLSQRST